jgi:hypothetical protein
MTTMSVRRRRPGYHRAAARTVVVAGDLEAGSALWMASAWLINLAVAEWAVRRRPAPRRRPQPAVVGGAAMSTATPYGYALRVDGHLDRHWRSRFGDLELTHHDDGTSTLAGPVADQSQLHGLLAGLRDIGATLLSVQPIDQPDPDERSPPFLGQAR